MVAGMPGARPTGGRAAGRLVRLARAAAAAFICLLVVRALAGWRPASLASPSCLEGCVSAQHVPGQPAAKQKKRVGWVGHTFDARPPSGLSVLEARQVASENFGNLVWAYGAWQLVDHNATQLVPLEPPGPYTAPVEVVLLPTANMLMNASKYEAIKAYTNTVLGIAEAVTAPIVLVGVGSQVRFEDQHGGGGGGGEAAAASDFSAASTVVLHPQQVAFLRRVEQSGGLTITRRKFTAALVEGAGLAPALPLGCPSLFINHDPSLGASLKRKWEAVVAARDPKLRLAVTLPKVHKDLPPPTDLLRLLAERVLGAFPASIVVLQTADDMNTLQLLHDRHGLYLPPHRIRYFYDVESWVDGLAACCDLVWGFRIHGTMAALMAGVPGVVISRDFRIKELAEAMAVPSADILHARLDPDAFDLFDFLEGSVAGAFAGFDARRRQVARVYAREFKRLGLALHPGIAALAASTG
ncbi:hypothetical protein CHLNCDRAFT_139033 [Chlorella variabilis]|uniref:Polysaccharide pyruvyl transferase domain-containing protein n=1 Tax=Chlorella variabilis TaxID=554065 RepID=E1ZPN2_CHLVA|nr:hypothetical protein CHLNCDRAFT_139033 [Chlorella variabilis]EFN52289.1 hypothetical protein CHLNCDRAFT_139033 [Chlorella variabilis]|eukprot:XP_005844391.1 hypothetical protein CHLNCDRAFT_139033 [Chlorella variabilis]